MKFDGHAASRNAVSVSVYARGELEITDLNKRYLAAGRLTVARMGRGFAWFDTGTFDSLIEAACFVQTLERRQGMKICCPEEIAYRMGYITETRFRGLAGALKKSGYGTYLEALVDADDVMVA
jgi:glucose-1-phosphate thymidylyltransferase